jgi:DNA polymerase-3 subunit delta'
MLLTDKPTQVLPTIASRCQPVRFDPLPTALVAQSLTGIPEPTATACARLSLGDGEKAKQLAFGDGPRLRAAAEALARAPLHGTTAQQRPWLAILQHARAQGTAARELLEKALAEELEYLPKKEHKRRQTEYAERARRADRRAATETLDHALQLAGLWYRDLAAVRAGAPELAFHADRAEELEADAHDRDPRALTTAQELVDDTRARLILNVSEELACEALAYRLEATLS